MHLSFFILFFFCKNTAKSQSTTVHYATSPGTFTTTVDTEEPLSSPLQLVATPDYPVAAGQRVDLHCTAFTMPDSVTWSWYRLQNLTWEEVGSGRDLTLTKPEQSGIYQCRAESRLSQRSTSASYTVLIISMRGTVAENLGIAAFVFSLLALIINLAILFWLSWQRVGDTVSTSSTVAKGFPAPEKSPKGGLPQTDSDRDVYMNYTSTNQGYSDLDPTNMTGDNVYSSLS